VVKRILIITCLIFSSLTSANFCKDIAVQYEEGTLTLADFLDACEEVALCTSSKRVPHDVAGKIITIKGIAYEIRFFSFEDTTGKITPQTTFREYAQKNNLLPIKNISTSPLPGIRFESFDFRKNPHKDGVYFSMALRKIENGDG
jgi:hypothetical protein